MFSRKYIAATSYVLCLHSEDMLFINVPDSDNVFHLFSAKISSL